ncbi:MAG: hypothetical protein HQ582_27295 [Planctomycetes bacterium]|nr:hypothetical protein [Planctomycetota bacterium]
MSEIRPTGAFIAYDDDGEEYEVIEFAAYIAGSHQEDPNAPPIPGPKHFQTTDGEPVQRVGEGVFKTIVGVTLRTDRGSTP